MDIQSAIRAVTEHRDLTAEEMTDVMRIIMGGNATPAQVGGFLIGLRMKGETVEEIAAAVKAGAKLKGVVVEKPLGRNMKEANRLVELAREAKL